MLEKCLHWRGNIDSKFSDICEDLLNCDKVLTFLVRDSILSPGKGQEPEPSLRLSDALSVSLIRPTQDLPAAFER